MEKETRFPLKPYQLAGARRIEQAFFNEGAQSFVLADEAGLGKTFVALQLIADYYERNCKNSQPWLNVYYLCSNVRILNQNGKKLEEKLSQFYPVYKPPCDRLSMACGYRPTHGINLYTMSASLLDASLSGGREDERTEFREQLRSLKPASADCQAVEQHCGKSIPELVKFLNKAAPAEGDQPLFENDRKEENKKRREEFGKIRDYFNRRSMAMNPPDLIILDEFHRMTRGKRGTSKTAAEQQQCLQYLKELVQDNPKVKLLYMSATPYPFTKEERKQAAEDYDRISDEDITAFQSFEDFLAFFLEDPSAVIAARNNHQQALRQLAAAKPQDYVRLWKAAEEKADMLAKLLKRFMSRCERGRIARLGAPEEMGDVQESLWTTLNWLQLSRDWTEGKTSYLRRIPGVYSYAIQHNHEHDVNKQRYAALTPKGDHAPEKEYLWTSDAGDPYKLQPLEESRWAHNPQLKALDETAVKGKEQLLWIPPIRQYYKADKGSPFAVNTAETMSKLLVFSNYQFIPRVIGSIFSTTVTQRNKTAARAVSLPDGYLQDTSLPQKTVEELAKRISQSDLSDCTELPLGDVIQKLTAAKSLSEEQVLQALGSPQICLYRLIASTSDDMKLALGEWSEIAAKAMVEWACKHSFLDKELPKKIRAKSTDDRSNRWEWFFYTNEHRNPELVKKVDADIESLTRYTYKDRRSGDNLWLWMLQQGMPLLKTTQKGKWTMGLRYTVSNADTSGSGRKISVTLEEDIAYQVVTPIKAAAEKALTGIDGCRKVLSAEEIPAFEKQVASILRETADEILRDRFQWLKETRLNFLSPYLAREDVQWALYAAGVNTARDFYRYCANGNLQAVLEEYLYLQDGNCWKLLEALESVLTLQGSKVYLLTEDVEAAKANPNDKTPLPCVTCGFSERYTGDNADTNAHNEPWQEQVQEAFNSPFWPMVLTTTSVAQEGLDFHQYCRRIMHYTVPTTPMALEQREGRIDRYHGFIQRLRRAKQSPGQSWEEMFAKDMDGSNGIIPGWVVPKEEGMPNMERVLGFLPFTEDSLDWEQLMCAKRQYRNAIGMPDDYALVADLENIADVLEPGDQKNTYRPENLFPDLTPTMP